MSAIERHQPSVVAIADGEFNQSLAVWHKEILHVLGLGVRVLGASSMGALRAAECDVYYGMEGVGLIYEWFRDGVLTDDDEVALLHGPAESDWVNLSWPMVNVRATVGKLQEAGEGLDATAAELILAATKGLEFGNRTEPALARRVRELGRTDGAELRPWSPATMSTRSASTPGARSGS
ncbi:MAG: TfuA-like protein [Acidimicrobiales bacterium]